MIRIGIVGDIGSGKSHVARLFGCPVFNADREVVKLYRKSKKCYIKLKKALPKYIISFPIISFSIPSLFPFFLFCFSHLGPLFGFFNFFQFPPLPCVIS